MVDCAWGDRYLDSMGCDGGQTAGALQWVMDNGGIATESSYRYLMQVRGPLGGGVGDVDAFTQSG